MHKLKQEGAEYNLSWKIMEKVNKPKPGKITCKFCLKNALRYHKRAPTA